MIPDVQAVTSATDGVSKNSVLATQNSSVKSEESVERNLGMKYYRYADSYGESKGCEEITKDEYDLINSQQLKGLVDINMTSDTVWSEDWVKLSQTEKRTTLEKLYDSFTYDKY